MDSFTPSQSPYQRNFESLLDPRIRPTVLALVNKGHLPCSSCQGHKLYKPRYIVLCFSSSEEREQFYQTIIRKWESFLFYTERHNTLAFERINETIFHYQSRENEILGYNQLFLKNYESYCFLRINIGLCFYNPKNISFFRLTLKKIFYSSFNFVFREALTRLLTFRIKNMPNSYT